ncbi:MAG: radical SAM protein, partial [Cyclobacteriaceae bacterium]|nr:radical SAM protein [Cyclobacteriaceae bacterium]
MQQKNRFEKFSFEPDDELYESELPTEYIYDYPKKIVNEVKSPDLNFNYSSNPYQGCEHGCSYCYARTTHDFWGFNSGLDFEK